MSENQGNIKKYISSNHNVICDVCGKKRKRSEVVNAYGSGDIAVVMSCRDGCADSRHPLNSPPPVIFDGQPVHDARPDPTEIHVTAVVPSFMTWKHFKNAGTWKTLNNPNNGFNLNGIWTWGNFKKI